MWFIQLVHPLMLDRLSFVLKPEHHLYNDITIEQAVLWVQEKYPDYSIVYCLPVGTWEGEKNATTD